MKLMIIAPSGSLLQLVNIRGIAEQDNGDLVLLHRDGTERKFTLKEWTAFRGERSLFENA